MAALHSDRPDLRVAVIGSGPAGFYTVQALFREQTRRVQVDMFDRLPAPFGLVRYGVAPDHQKIKSTTKIYHKLALDPRFRFFGNVDFGRDLGLADLKQHYHQVVFCTGAQTDRNMGIEGEHLPGSHAATDFVAWYNGHPDYVDRRFDLGHERVLVIGVGNVAVDVARILCRTVDELATTDIADYALDALRKSRVREVWLVGRRGPAQAAFTNPEVKELGELPGARTTTLPSEVELDSLTRQWLERNPDRATRRKIELLRSYADREDPGKPRLLQIRFLLSPVELLGDEAGGLRAVRLERNALEAGRGDKLRSVGTGETEVVETGLVFRSVGYRGVPLSGIPFRDDWGIIPNARGRVLDGVDGPTLRGLYVSGWIKRGPSGVIGTNKPDAVETVACMLEDLQSGATWQPEDLSAESVPALLHQRGIRFVDYPAWTRLDAKEVADGRERGRPRVKLTTRGEFLEALAGLDD